MPEKDTSRAPEGASPEARAADVVVLACERALATSTEQNSKAGAFPPTVIERAAVLEVFRAALFSDIIEGPRS